jgi:signal transduction histidine kinase
VSPTRWPVRVRLTLLYAAAFLAAGVVLVGVSYSLVSMSLQQPIDTRMHLGEPRPHPGAREAAEAVKAYRSESLSSLLSWSLLALAGALVVAVVLGWILAGRALQPLRQITDTANRVAHRSLHERIALDGPHDEVKELADTIDAILERLDRSFDVQRRFVANASHELRTPLTTTPTLLEVALGDPEVSDDLKRLAPTLLTTNERSEQLIERLLTLARSEQEVTERTALDLADLAAVVVKQEQPDARERAITVSTDLRPAPVVGSPVLMERLAANLVQNAIRHSPSGVEAIVRTDRSDDLSILQVENPGAVLRQHEVDEMFEPFRRGDERVRNDCSVGLGLSIVRAVAQAHGGRATAYPWDGGGLVVRVELPARRDLRRSGDRRGSRSRTAH